MRDHGGQIKALAAKLQVTLPKGPLHDFSASLSPLGMPPALQSIVDIWKNQCAHYPSPDAESACQVLAVAHGLSMEQVLCGNGSTELFALALQASKVRTCTVFPPCWSGYQEACKAADVFCQQGKSWNAVQDGEAMILASPNNPDGILLDPESVRAFCLERPKVQVLLDLAFDDFLHSPAQSPWWQGQPWPGNLVRIKSLTKFFGIPGLRLGFLAVGDGSAAQVHMESLRQRVLPWNVNALAQWCAEHLYEDDAWQDLARSVTQERRNALLHILQNHGFAASPCAAWVLATPPDGQLAEAVQKKLLEQGICVRVVTDNKLRLGLPNPEALNALQAALDRNFAHTASTPAILIAGTGSDAGKSVIAAGLCAVLHKHGYKPYPFKAQNMSNHAWVTAEGGEIGWAQAVQAFAAGVEPHVDMNPILLKPGSGQRSHVVLCGIDSGSLSVQEYHARFQEYRQHALAAYDRIAQRAGIIVLEGAGGIAEINLRHRDLSNREAPLHAQARIVIVGDIERGGVFASLYGSWAMLEESLRPFVRGFVINRFRGDASLLDSGIKELEQRTGVPVLGVVPFQENLSLGEEDSMAFGEETLPPPGGLRVGIIRLPHLSNGNDWLSLQNLPGVSVFCSSQSLALSQADVLIVPGTRASITDLRWLKDRGLASVIQTHIQHKRPLLALCGGMQMLGQQISDPDGIEGPCGDQEQGLGVFPLHTVLQVQGKTVRPRHERIAEDRAMQIPWLPKGLLVRGYEIHCGKSNLCGPLPAGMVEWLDGLVQQNGKVWGTYWHGILQSSALACAWLGLPPIEQTAFLQKGIEQAQRLVEENIDWKPLLS